MENLSLSTFQPPSTPANQPTCGPPKPAICRPTMHSTRKYHLCFRSARLAGRAVIPGSSKNNLQVHMTSYAAVAAQLPEAATSTSSTGNVHQAYLQFTLPWLGDETWLRERYSCIMYSETKAPQPVSQGQWALGPNRNHAQFT